MKRFFFSVLVSLTLLALTTGTVFAGSAVELVSVSNDGGGPTFVFRVSGEFSKGELHGFAQVEGGDSFPLSCVKTDETTVVCHASKKVGGQNVVVGFGGARFWHRVPEPHNGGGGTSQYCHPVYDWDYDTKSFWALQGTNCQDSEAQFGDFIYNFYAPDWDEYYDYEYRPGDVCGWADPGAAYYPDWDPECPDDDD